MPQKWRNMVGKKRIGYNELEQDKFFHSLFKAGIEAIYKGVRLGCFHHQVKYNARARLVTCCDAKI